MQRLNKERAERWVADWGIDSIALFKSTEVPEHTGIEIGELPVANDLHRFALSLEPLLGHWREALVYFTEIGRFDWDNYDLFNRTVNDPFGQIAVADVPGHCFGAHEKSWLHSLLEVAIINSWDATVLGNLDYGRIYISHRGIIRITTADLIAWDRFKEKNLVSKFSEWSVPSVPSPTKSE